MASSVIGALRVNLGIDTAQFESGLKKSTSSLGRWQTAAIAGVAAVGAAVTSFAVGLAAAVGQAIGTFDEMGKTAQKAGVTVEALTRLNYAAGLSDVSLAQLSTGLQRLGRSMDEIAGGKGGAAADAMRRLGVSVTDAAGNLRSTDDVMLDLADKLSRMEDGAEKTALAIAIFGRAGAELLPMLNAGRDGLAEMAAESDRFGTTLGTRATKAAEVFNDNITRLGSMFQGFVNKIAGAVLPALAGLSQWLIDTALDSGVLEAASNGLIWMFGEVRKGIAFTIATFSVLKEAIVGTALAMHRATTGDWMGAFTAAQAGWEGITKAVQDYQTELANATAEQLGLTKDDGWGEIRSRIESAADASTSFAGTAGRALADVGSAAADLADKQIKPLADGFKAVGSAVSSALSGFISDVIKGEDAISNLGKAIGDMGDRLLQMAIDQAIQALLGNLMSAFTGGFGGFKTNPAGFIKGGFFPGFDGGGFTGFGARTGGLDGKGGFPAILHPNETVIDHTKGQGVGANITIQISGSKQDAAAIARELRPVMLDVVKQYQANPYRRS